MTRRMDRCGGWAGGESTDAWLHRSEKLEELAAARTSGLRHSLAMEAGVAAELKAAPSTGASTHRCRLADFFLETASLAPQGLGVESRPAWFCCLLLALARDSPSLPDRLALLVVELREWRTQSLPSKIHPPPVPVGLPLPADLAAPCFASPCVLLRLVVRCMPTEFSLVSPVVMTPRRQGYLRHEDGVYGRGMLRD